jgi:DNA-binding transcriptional MerR regulator
MVYASPVVDETPAERPLKAGELARKVGVSKDTLRFYERKGLLPHPLRLGNNYRVYPPETVERVLWIRRILAAGFTVEELAEILGERERGGIPCRKVRALGGVKLAEIEDRLRDLETARDALQALLQEWDRRLAETRPGKRAGLLESLPPLPTDGKKTRKAEIR